MKLLAIIPFCFVLLFCYTFFDVISDIFKPQYRHLLAMSIATALLQLVGMLVALAGTVAAIKIFPWKWKP